MPFKTNKFMALKMSANINLVIINKGKGGFHHYPKADTPTNIHLVLIDHLMYFHNNPLSGKVTVH